MKLMIGQIHQEGVNWCLKHNIYIYFLKKPPPFLKEQLTEIFKKLSK